MSDVQAQADQSALSQSLYRHCANQSWVAAHVNAACYIKFKNFKAVYFSILRISAEAKCKKYADSCISIDKHKNCIFTLSNQYRWKPDIATSWEIQQKLFSMSLSSLHMWIKVYVKKSFYSFQVVNATKSLSIPRTITENVVHYIEFLDLPSG